MTYTWPPGPSQGSQPGGTVVNARVTRGHTFLITGIGGGVALLALKLCLALGARMCWKGSSEDHYLTRLSTRLEGRLPRLTMGSKADLQAATDFIAQHRIAPVVSRVLDGLENAEEGFGLLARGEHFGKFVIMVDGSSTNAKL
ncbi:hypothetical protein F5888DRAFT_1637810 [Russula emetica]|nr:hypothetical protein F5888DRAFT_1637810 [Russula emetica]